MKTRETSLTKSDLRVIKKILDDKYEIYIWLAMNADNLENKKVIHQDANQIAKIVEKIEKELKDND